LATHLLKTVSLPKCKKKYARGVKIKQKIPSASAGDQNSDVHFLT